MNSSLKVSIVSGLGLVSSNSDWDRLAGGNDLGVEGQWLDSNSWDGIGQSMVVGWDSSIDQLRLSLSLSIVDNWGMDGVG